MELQMTISPERVHKALTDGLNGTVIASTAALEVVGVSRKRGAKGERGPYVVDFAKVTPKKPTAKTAPKAPADATPNDKG